VDGHGHGCGHGRDLGRGWGYGFVYGWAISNGREKRSVEGNDEVSGVVVENGNGVVVENGNGEGNRNNVDDEEI